MTKLMAFDLDGTILFNRAVEPATERAIAHWQAEGNKSGTCWAYSTISFFESEILRKTGKTYDLSEMFVAGKTYMDRAIKAVTGMTFEQERSILRLLFKSWSY